MVVQELIAKLGFDVDQGGLNKADQGLDKLANSALKMIGKLYLAKKAWDAVVWGVMGSISAASEKEDVTTQFKVLLGDLETAKYLYQEINQYAAVSPFETAGLAENTKTLIAMGMSAKSAFTDLKMLGDVALGDQNKLNRMALTYGQVMSLGRLQGDNMREFALQGWNPLTYWQAKSGKSMEQLRKDMEKGLITAAMVQEALQAATAQGGRFYKGAEEGSKTWSGMLSTMRDNVRMLGAELGERLLPFLKEILRAFGELWDTVASAFRNMATAMSLFAEGMPEAVTWGVVLATIFGTIADSIVLAMTTLQGFIFAFQFVAQGVAMLIGGALDLIFLIPKAFASAAIAAGKAILYLGKMAAKVLPKGTINLRSIAEMEVGADKAQELLVGNPLEYTERARYNGGPEVAASWDKFISLGNMIGKEESGAGKISLTDRMEKILAGVSSKQPITNITQNNNLTVNAEDPIKTMSESASAKFFQGAFLQIRNATT